MSTPTARAIGLDAVGELSYNGFNFGGAETIKVVGTKVYDDAQRMVMYVKYTITVTAVVGNGEDSADVAMAEMHRRLSEPGKSLILKQKGFGNGIRVNSTQGNSRDVNWGPKPLELQMTPVGGNLATLVVFTIETCLPECDCIACGRSSGVMALNFDVKIDVDKHGDTKRTINGHIQIAQSRVGNSLRPPDDADQYWHIIAPAQLPGFHRERDRKLSLDKSRLDFTIKDEQIPSYNAYPQHVVEIEAQHRTSWRRVKDGTAWYMNSLRVRITPSARIKPEHAWLVFLQLLDQRRKASEALRRYPMLQSLEAEESIFGRGQSFSATWRVLAAKEDYSRKGIGLNQFIEAVGMFTPTDSTWQAHAASLADVQAFRGTARMITSPGHDVLVDLCTPAASSSPSDAIYGRQPDDSPVFFARDAVENKTPPPEASWIAFNSNLRVYKMPHLTRHSVIKRSTTEDSGWRPEEGEAAAHPDFGPAGAEDIMSIHGEPRYRAVFTGRAKRIGHPIPRPRLATIGGISTVEAESSTFDSRAAGRLYGQPLYVAKWRITYYLAASPGAVKPPARPDEVFE